MSYAQFSEDVIVDDLLGHPPDGLVVDIGAGDGLHISNSALFRLRGWRTVLIEPDPLHADALAELKSPTCTVVREPVTPANINALVPADTTILSIDVDGDDYFLLDALDHHPVAVIVEHNPTMPYHVDVAPARLGLRIGASVGALRRVARGKGYGLVAVTHCNAVFMRDAADMPLPPYLPAYYVATEYFTGQPITLGVPPWGVDFANPYSPEDIVLR